MAKATAPEFAIPMGIPEQLDAHDIFQIRKRIKDSVRDYPLGSIERKALIEAGRGLQSAIRALDKAVDQRRDAMRRGLR